MGKMLFEMLVCHLPRLPASCIKQPFLSHHHLPLEYGVLRSQPPNLNLELVLCPVTKGYNCFKNSPPMLINFFRCHINTLLLETDGLSKKKKKKVFCVNLHFLHHGKVDPSQGIPGSVRAFFTHMRFYSK